MPAVTTLVLNDAQATPVAHTYNPSGPDKDRVSWWYSDQSEFPVAAPSLSISLKRSSGGNDPLRHRFHFALPMVEIPSGETYPVLLGTNRCHIDMIIHPKSTKEDRETILTFASQFLALQFAKAIVGNSEAVY